MNHVFVEMRTDDKSVSERNEFVMNNLEIAKASAYKYARKIPGADWNDLFQIGTIALAQAFDRFDPSKGDQIHYAKKYVRGWILTQYRLSKHEKENGKAISGDASFSEDNDGTLFSTISSENHVKADVNCDKKFAVEALKSLNERDAYIIARIYGIGCDPAKYETIGAEVELSVSAVCAIHNRALRELRAVLS